jgi:iron complex transport system substrate-binding protein
MRIASLLASGTELVCELGAGDELVARSHECDYPAWVKQLPCVSEPTFDVTGSSSEIDALVRQKLAAHEPLYRVDEQRLLELRPDVIITQTHCEVCAVTPGNLSLCRNQVASLHDGTLDGILRGFIDVGRAIGRDAEPLVGRIRARLAEVRERLAGVARPTVVCLEWLDPIFNMGNWGPEVIELAGGTNVLGTPGTHSTVTPWQAIRDADPDVLLVSGCGFTVERSLREFHLLAAQPGFSELRAVRSGKVYIADGNLYFNRSSPHVFKTVELLAAVLHPDRFSLRDLDPVPERILRVAPLHAG